jgi:thiol-disulfide isomerase/thioredoxin
VESGALVLVAVLVVATALGYLLTRYNGHFRGAARSAPSVEARDLVTAADIGAPLGERATLLQFSSAFCAPCRATRRTLHDVAEMVDGVAHVEVDAEHHLELVRRLGVMRTPTVFVLDAAGSVVKRASGQPRKPDVVAALGLAIK